MHGRSKHAYTLFMLCISANLSKLLCFIEYKHKTHISEEYLFDSSWSIQLKSRVMKKRRPQIILTLLHLFDNLKWNFNFKLFQRHPHHPTRSLSAYSAPACIVYSYVMKDILESYFVVSSSDSFAWSIFSIFLQNNEKHVFRK